MTSLDPCFRVDSKLLCRLQKRIGLRLGYSAGKVVFAVVALRAAPVEIGGQRRKGGVRRFKGKKCIVMTPDCAGTIALGAHDDEGKCSSRVVSEHEPRIRREARRRDVFQ